MFYFSPGFVSSSLCATASDASNTDFSVLFIWLSFIEIPPIPSQVVVLKSRWYLAKVRIALGCGGCEREHLLGKHWNPCHASVHTQRSDYLGKPHICGREGHEIFYIWTLFLQIGCALALFLKRDWYKCDMWRKLMVSQMATRSHATDGARSTPVLCEMKMRMKWEDENDDMGETVAEQVAERWFWRPAGREPGWLGTRASIVGTGGWGGGGGGTIQSQHWNNTVPPLWTATTNAAESRYTHPLQFNTVHSSFLKAALPDTPMCWSHLCHTKWWTMLSRSTIEQRYTYQGMARTICRQTSLLIVHFQIYHLGSKFLLHYHTTSIANCILSQMSSSSSLETNCTQISETIIRRASAPRFQQKRDQFNSHLCYLSKIYCFETFQINISYFSQHKLPFQINGKINQTSESN